MLFVFCWFSYTFPLWTRLHTQQRLLSFRTKFCHEYSWKSELVACLVCWSYTYELSMVWRFALYQSIDCWIHCTEYSKSLRQSCPCRFNLLWRLKKQSRRSPVKITIAHQTNGLHSSGHKQQAKVHTMRMMCTYCMYSVEKWTWEYSCNCQCEPFQIKISHFIRNWKKKPLTFIQSLRLLCDGRHQ